MLRFMKAGPTTYVILYQGGKIRREGTGLSFLYYAPTSTIVAIPLASRDLPFAFTEVTADFQTVTLQGQLTYRIADPGKITKVLDYSVRSNGGYATDSPEKLPERLVQTTQMLTRAFIERRPLREALVSADALASVVTAGLRQAETIALLGIEILSVTFMSVRPTPEMARALEAAAREALQRESDEAIYARRNAAVESERQIKESELNTEIAVAEKQRRIRETQMAAEIAVEEQRAALIERRSANDRRDADARGYAIQATLEPLKSVDWHTLMALGASGGDPKLMIALAFREMAENAGKIGELNISPDLLRSLLTTPPAPK